MGCAERLARQAEETPDLRQLLGARAFGGQAGEKHGPVATARDAPLEDSHHAAIAARAHQTAEPLFQRERGPRELKTVERIAAILADALDARCGQWIVGHGKGQAIDHYQGKRLTGNVHSYEIPAPDRLVAPVICQEMDPSAW